jgi:hypothetical protein
VRKLNLLPFVLLTVWTACTDSDSSFDTGMYIVTPKWSNFIYQERARVYHLCSKSTDACILINRKEYTVVRHTYLKDKL